MAATCWSGESGAEREMTGLFPSAGHEAPNGVSQKKRHKEVGTMRNQVKTVLVLLSVVLAGAVVFALCGKPAVSDAAELKKEEITSDEAHRLFEEAARLKEQGHGDEAAELFGKAERVEAEAREKRRHEQELREEAERVIPEEARDLFEKARRLKQEGRLDEAEEVGRKAERIEAEARERKQMGTERRPDREALLEEVRQLVEKAERAAAEGRGGEAEELRVRAERLEAKARGLEGEPSEKVERKEALGRGEVLELLRRKLLEAQRKLDLLSERYGAKHPERLTAERIVRKIEEQLALEEGRQVREKYARADREIPEEARRPLEKAAEIRRQADRRDWAEKVEVAIREHLEESRRLKEQGKLDAAEEHFREAERLKRGLREAMPREEEFRPPEPPFVREELRAPLPQEPPFRPEMPGPQNVLAEIRELRRDINGLREELSEIKRLLRELVEK